MTQILPASSPVGESENFPWSSGSAPSPERKADADIHVIRWLVQSTDACPGLREALAPVDLLSPEEALQFSTLKTTKRAHDWLLGRWTARRLLHWLYPDRAEDWSVLTSIGGAPVITLPNGRPESAINLSISHSKEYALCALVESNEWMIGADLEYVEPRSGDFVVDYFTSTEIARIIRAPLASRPILINAMWSAKEAALKALRVGLTVDTRSVSCLITAPSVPPQTWLPFELQWHAGPALRLTGWWRTMNDFVLTLVACHVC